ncbi:MAG TPA: alpha/beta hydrolase [Aggregicoccus sp.]|nr:alpha/beta hydrolase [Aggregicoccus sp.]
MVLKGQFLERSTLIPLQGAGVVLEGTAHRGERQPPLLVLPPRPEEGGGMDHVLAAELAFAAARSGHATLRFNYRGVGASQGGRGGSLVEDASAALDVALENARARTAAVAALHGSAPVALELAAQRPEACGLCLIGPRELSLPALERLSVPLLVILWAGDTRTPRAPLAAALAASGGTLELVQDEGPAFPRNLPAVGHLVARWLQALSGAASPNS